MAAGQTGAGADVNSVATRRRARRVPLLRGLLYYSALVGIGLLLIELVPGAHLAINAPVATGSSSAVDVVSGRSSAIATGVGATPWQGPLGRLGLAVFCVTGALLLALPVAWVHMFTRRLRFDPSLVHTIIILPIVVGGVVLVVKNSLALAFALAGIVAGVRFRQKLKEPQDAVYVLLALGIGLAAGVQALDVALAVSLIFNIVVLSLWRYDVGSMHSPGAGPFLATGDTSVIAPRDPEAQRELRARMAGLAEGMDMDGILLVYTRDRDAARGAVDLTLAGVARDWRHFSRDADPGGDARLDVAVLFNNDGEPVELLGDLEERWSAYVVAAEYIPYRVRRSTKKNRDEDEMD